MLLVHGAQDDNAGTFPMQSERLFQAQTEYLKSRYAYITDLLTLEQASGQLDEAWLNRVNQWLKETVSVQ